jgi:hypothetical protein
VPSGSRQQLKQIDEIPPDEIARRRTFAIISHPDAGETTLTEKLLLFGGAIQLAGEVKARGERRRVRSDWMAVERERGISVSSAVMSFEHEGLAFNLLDTPGHQDFSPLGFQRGHYRFRLSTEQPCGCHNRTVFSCLSAPTIGRVVRSGGSWRYLIST